MQERVKAIEAQIEECQSAFNDASDRQSDAGKEARKQLKKIDDLRTDLLTLYRGQPLTAVAKAKAS